MRKFKSRPRLQCPDRVATLPRRSIQSSIARCAVRTCVRHGVRIAEHQRTAPLGERVQPKSALRSEGMMARRGSSAQGQASHPLNTSPWPVRDRKLTDMHWAHSHLRGCWPWPTPSSCPSSPYTAPGHDCAVITRPLVPQWAHIRRPPRTSRGALAPDEGGNRTQSGLMPGRGGCSVRYGARMGARYDDRCTRPPAVPRYQKFVEAIRR